MGKRICVVGAGVAGLACAIELQKLGHEVVIYEKSREICGRLATRKTDGFSFDHGAQYVSAKGDDFRQFIAERVAAGAAAEWTFTERGEDEAETRVVGVPGMPDLFRSLAEDLDIRFPIEIGAIARDDAGWRVAGELYDCVLSTAPGPQTVDLFNDHSDITVAASQAYYAPCMALLFAVDAPSGLDFDCARNVSDAIAWVARNSSKPGRALECTQKAGESWVVHATPKWSAQRLDVDKSEIADQLLLAFKDAFAEAVLPDEFPYIAGHRWRYAQVLKGLDEPCLFDPETMLGACGDWCIDARVEAAFDSGLALARTVDAAS